jgi:hypothetical protein
MALALSCTICVPQACEKWWGYMSKFNNHGHANNGGDIVSNIRKPYVKTAV